MVSREQSSDLQRLKRKFDNGACRLLSETLPLVTLSHMDSHLEDAAIEMVGPKSGTPGKIIALKQEDRPILNLVVDQHGSLTS